MYLTTLMELFLIWSALSSEKGLWAGTWELQAVGGLRFGKWAFVNGM